MSKKKNNDNGGTGLLIGGAIFLLTSGLSKIYINVKNKKRLKQQAMNLEKFGRNLDELFSRYQNKNTNFKEFEEDKVFLKRDEKFKAIEKIRCDYETEFKKDFSLTDEFFDLNFELKGEKEARRLKVLIDDENQNPFRDKLMELSNKYNIDLINCISSIIGANKEQIIKINDYIIKQYNILKAGIEGENRVANELNKFGDVYKIFSNITIQVGDDIVEYDNLVICNGGILVFEVKNIGEHGQCKLIISEDGQFKKVKIGHEDNTYFGYTPSSQVYYQALILDKLLKSKLKEHGNDYKTLNIKPIVVIANDNVEIENKSKLTVIRVSEIYHMIFDNNKLKSFFSLFSRHNELSSDLINEICNIISENSKEDKKFETYIPKKFIYNIEANLEAIQFIKDIYNLAEPYTF